MSESGNNRPRYDPLPCSPKDELNKLALSTDSSLEAVPMDWIPILSCNADFPLELLEIAMLQLINHPEYNSTLILRSETVRDSSIAEEVPVGVPEIVGFRSVRNIRRKLLARRPGRDPPIEQNCTLYIRCSKDSHCGDDERAGRGEEDAERISCVILSPILKPGEAMPFYHPTVTHLAFRYIASDASGDNARLRIEVVPLPSTPSAPPPTDPNSRLYRTCLALLETVHRYGYGALTNYQKRVHHDCIVPREEYQDLYLVMRERHKHLVSEWKETTDPSKHVFEDIGIATFLMLLWKQSKFVAADSGKPQASGIELNDDSTPKPSSERMPWHDWPRPPAGFLDLGCGNGLLTHILTSEGYYGTGIDLRARTSWSHYPPSTQARLQVHALDPLSLHPNDPQSHEAAISPLPSFLAPGVFIIANHADELTPWTPLLATLTNASGYLSIPCCAWSFDAKFERGVASNGPVPSIIQPGENANESLAIGGGNVGATSAYALYRVWLANLSLWCGWENEYENLRIPSTRNWAIVARNRKVVSKRELDPDEGVALDNVKGILQWVRERGIFKTRRPEGRAGDH